MICSCRCLGPAWLGTFLERLIQGTFPSLDPRFPEQQLPVVCWTSSPGFSPDSSGVTERSLSPWRTSRRCGVYSLPWSDSVHPAILELAGEDPPTALSSSHHLSSLVLSTLHSLLPVWPGTLVSVLIHFFPEGPSLRHIPALPQIQEIPVHERLISDPVRGKVPQGLQRLCPSSLPGSIISIAGRRVCHSPPLFRRVMPS